MNKGTIPVSAIIGLIFVVAIIVFVGAFAFKIPGLIGQLLGMATSALIATGATLWDMLNKILGPIFNPIRSAALIGGVALPIALSLGGKIITSKLGSSLIDLASAPFTRGGLGRSINWAVSLGRVKNAWKDAVNGVKGSFSNLSVNSVKSFFSWSHLKAMGGAIKSGVMGFAKGAAIGFVVELAVGAGLDYIAGGNFAQTVNNALGTSPVRLGSIGGLDVNWDTGSAVKGAISGAAAGAAIGAFGGPVGMAIGAGIGALIGFISSGFLGA